MTTIVPLQKETDQVGGHFYPQFDEKNDIIFLPRALVEIMPQYNLDDLDSLVSFLHTYPSVIADELGWTVQQAMSAEREFVQWLSERIPRFVAHTSKQAPIRHFAVSPKRPRVDCVKTRRGHDGQS